jgi:hypothetical protein
MSILFISHATVRDARSEIRKLEQMNAELRAAKDRDEVRAIDRRHSGIEETFNALVEDVEECAQGAESSGGGGALRDGGRPCLGPPAIHKLKPSGRTRSVPALSR